MQHQNESIKRKVWGEVDTGGYRVIDTLSQFELFILKLVCSADEAFTLTWFGRLDDSLFSSSLGFRRKLGFSSCNS